MELKKEHIYFGAACLIAGALLGAGLRGCGIKKSAPAKPVYIHDTLTIRDTVRLAGKTKTLYITRFDTVYTVSDVIQYQTDNSQYTTDSHNNFAVVPIEQKEYRDTFLTDSSRIELGVLFSGYQAKIDGIDLKSSYTVEPQTIVKKKGWGQFIGVGVGLGYGGSVVNQRIYAAPEVGIHITYGWGFHW